jgi:hypothetical protein
MAVNSMAPTASGTQPPSNTFIILAATKARSTTTNTPATATLKARLQPHTSRIARNINIEVSNMVVATAMPKADARASEERKLSARPTVSAIKAQLTKPT